MNRCDINVNHRFPTITTKKIFKNVKGADVIIIIEEKKIGKNNGKTRARRTCVKSDGLRARLVADELERGKDV